MQPHTFRKSERLADRSLVDQLFEEGKGYTPRNFTPNSLRLKYLLQPIGQGVTEETVPFKGSVRVLFAVPKKRFRRAHDRNRIRRQLREVYRQHKGPLLEASRQKEVSVRIAILVTATEMPTFEALSLQLQEVMQYLEAQILRWQAQS